MPEIVRTQVEIPQEFFPKYVFKMWVAFRAEKGKLLTRHGRDRFLDYTLDIIRDAEIEYKFTKGGIEYTASILSAKTIDNFLKSGEADSSITGRKSNFLRKTSISNKTLSYIFIFLYAMRPAEVSSWENHPEDVSIGVEDFYASIDEASKMRISFSPFKQIHSTPFLLLSTIPQASQSSISIARIAHSHESVFTNTDKILNMAYVVSFFQTRRAPLDAVFYCPLYILKERYQAKVNPIALNKFIEPLDSFFYHSLGFLEPVIALEKANFQAYMGQFQGVASKYYNEESRLKFQFSNYGDVHNVEFEQDRLVKPSVYHKMSLKFLEPSFVVGSESGTVRYIPTFLSEVDSEYVRDICKNYIGNVI